MAKTVFIENKSGVIHETTESIAKYMVGQGECVYAQSPEKEDKKGKAESKNAQSPEKEDTK